MSGDDFEESFDNLRKILTKLIGDLGEPSLKPEQRRQVIKLMRKYLDALEEATK